MQFLRPSTRIQRSAFFILLLTKKCKSQTTHFGGSRVGKDTKGLKIELYSENMSTMFIVTQMLSKPKKLMREVQQLHKELWRSGIHLETQYIPSAYELMRRSLIETKDDIRLLPSDNG